MPRAKRRSSGANDTKLDKAETSPETQAVRKLFSEAQRTIQCHERCSDALLRLLSKHESAWVEYFSCLSRILVFSKRDPGVERLVQFVILAAGSDEKSLFDRTVEFLLRHSGAADKAVRFRCCQLLAPLTIKYTQRPGVEDDDLVRFVDVLLPRLRDKVSTVRVQAVGALRPFQFKVEAEEDKESLEDDRVRNELLRVVASDSSPDVRQAALIAVTKTRCMLDQLVLRTQDVKESVRKAAFHTLGTDVSSKHLDRQQRATLVKRGLSDPSEAVVNACRLMLCVHWFRDVGYDPVELLQRLEFVGFDKMPELAMREIVRLGLRADRERGDPSLGMGLTLEDAKGLREAANRRVDLSAPSRPGEGRGNGSGGGISAEEALYARVQAEVVKEDKVMSAGEKETRLEAIMTDTTTLCEQIEANSKELEVLRDSGLDDDGELIAGEFVLEQLLKLACLADFSEEAGRRRLVNLLQDLLRDVGWGDDLVEPSMLALFAAHTSEKDFVRVVAELVSDISDLINKRPPPVGDDPVLNTSLNASLASVVENLGDGGTPNRSFATLRSAVRAAIPKNFVRDRARAIEGIAPMAGMSEEDLPSLGPGLGGGGGVEGSGGEGAEPAVSSEDEFMDAMSHLSSADDDENDGSGEALRQVSSGIDETAPAPVAYGVPNDGVNGDGDDYYSQVNGDIHRLLRILDILSVLLSKTKQTLAKDATLTAFEDDIMDVFAWTTKVLPELHPEIHDFGPVLRALATETLGKYCLLGEAAAVRHYPMLLKMCEHEVVGVRVSAMKALSDLSLTYRSSVMGTNGDALTVFTDVLKDRSASRMTVAVASEAVSRFLFFELTHDPELLARLIILYFEKDSAADPKFDATLGGGQGEEVDGEAGVANEEMDDPKGDENQLLDDPKAIGSKGRLSQILWVYFRSLLSAGPGVQDMLFESVRHVLKLLREIAKDNARAEVNNRKAGAEEVKLIVVPAHDVVKFVLKLLISQQEVSASCAAAAAAAEPASTTKTKHEEAGAEEVEEEEEGREETRGKDVPEKQCLSSDSDKTSSSSSSRSASVLGVDANGHVALCITDELWTLSGIDGASDLVASLAQVLKSLPLPVDDQVMLKRLRNSVDRLQAQGDGRLSASVSRIIAKYAAVLLTADLTPDVLREDSDDDEEKEQEKARSSDIAEVVTPPVLPSRRPSRQSKVAAQKRMASAEAEAMTAAADESSEEASGSSGGEEEDEDEDEGRSKTDDVAETIGERGHEPAGDSDDDDDEDDDDDSTASKVASPLPPPGAAKVLRGGRRGSARATAAPLSEISNSPFRA